MKKQAFDSAEYCSAMRYYLNHIKLDLSLGRMDFFRHFADHVGAMMSGFTTVGVVYKGDWKKFKTTCYASGEALRIFEEEGWSTKGLRMEHVVPIKVIGGYLLEKQQMQSVPLTCQEILDVLENLLIPCLITKAEDEKFGSGLTNLMPPEWKYEPIVNNQWDRYLETDSCSTPGGKLFNDIVAISPQTWMSKPNFPSPPPNPKKLPPKLTALAPVPYRDCINSLECGLTNGCMQRES